MAVRCRPESISPVARGVLAHCCTAPPCPEMIAPRAQFANCFRDSLPAAPRCPAIRGRPTSCSPLARRCGVVPCATLLLRVPLCECAARHATLRVARASGSGRSSPDITARTCAPRRHVQRCSRHAPNSQRCFCYLLPAKPRVPAVRRRPAYFSPVAHGVAVCCRARRFQLSVACGLAARSCFARRCGPHSCAAPCPEMLVPRAQVANRLVPAPNAFLFVV